MVFREFGPRLWPGTGMTPGILEGKMSLITINTAGIQKAATDFF